MKILIVGKKSYIGDHIDEWLSSRDMVVNQLDVLTDEWKTFDYSSYDSIVHVAGIVHRPDCDDWDLFKRVNAEMPISIATMAKEQGVKQYVFISTMGVYGVDKSLRPNIIDNCTPLNANSMYGKSKKMAEEGLFNLQDEAFNVVVVRPPSVYGKGCRGGYITGFTTIAQKLPIIPRAYENVKQSFIYIDNLSELVRLVIEKKLNGVFCPQDDRALCASELLRILSGGIGKKYRSSWLLGQGVRLLHFIPIVKKAFGGVEYSPELSSIKDVDYVVVPIEEGMKRTVS